MRLTIVPPYRGAGYDFKPEDEPYYHRVIDLLREDGQLDGVSVDIDPGVHTDHVSSTRDEAVFDHLAVAVQERVRAITERAEHDAIVVLGGIDVGFHAARLVSPIPVAFPIHSSLHVASLVADRFSLIDVTDPQAKRVRRLARIYELDHKLTSVRAVGRSSTDLSPILRDARDGTLSPATEAALDQVVEQCRLAVEEDGAELVIISFTPFQCLQREVRERLDAAGMAEIPVLWILSAAVAVAKAMVEANLLPAPRAYPADSLVAKPAFR